MSRSAYWLAENQPEVTYCRFCGLSDLQAFPCCFRAALRDEARIGTAIDYRVMLARELDARRIERIKGRRPKPAVYALMDAIAVSFPQFETLRGYVERHHGGPIA